MTTPEIDTSTLLVNSASARSVTAAEIRDLSPNLDGLRQQVRAWRTGEPYSFFHLPYRDDTARIAALGQTLATRFARTVVFGIGGSSLGGEMLVRALGRPDHPVQFFDNIDPLTLEALTHVDWPTTLLLVISKSGQTAETLAQFLGVLPTLEKQLESRLPEHVRVITEDRQGALAHLATELGLEILDHPAVGGRFSVLSIVGLLPAAIAGVDIERLITGARGMADQCAIAEIDQNPAFYQGTAQFLHASHGRRIAVVMPYVDRLRPLGMWFRQLCAESLGKHDRHGTPMGLTPALAMGVTDQHSQLQLYLEGPDDKQFTLLADPALASLGARVSDRFAHLPAVQPLAGHTVGELLLAEFRATRETLTRHGRPNRTVLMNTRDAAQLGALLFQIEMEIVVIAELLGVDPFDQPAVEEGKRLAREYLAKSR